MPAIREVPKIAKWIRWVTRTDNKIYVSLSVPEIRSEQIRTDSNRLLLIFFKKSAHNPLKFQPVCINKVQKT